MKIKRIVNGQELEFELTAQERWEAYYEQEKIYDTEDCADMITGLSDEQCLDAYEITAEEFRKLLPYMAQEKRRLMDKYDMEWTNARDKAVSSVIRAYKEGKIA